MTSDPFLDPERPNLLRRLFSKIPGFSGISFSGFWKGKIIVRLVLFLLAVFVLYYPIGMVWVHKINDDPNFAVTAVPEGESRAVALAAALINREVRKTHWPANDPIFMPGWALDNMPNFQRGLKEALARFANEMADQLGRSRGSSSSDPDLLAARGYLNYPPDIWLWNPDVSWWAPTASSEAQYLAAMRALESYNERLGRNDATFERRSDNLLTTLDRFGKDLGAASNSIDQQIETASGQWLDFHADDVFYFNKGQLYGYSLLLRDLGIDFQKVIEEKGAANVWNRMVSSMAEGASLAPLVVINGSPNALLQPNHLAIQGFYLLRARTQLEEITDILQK